MLLRALYLHHWVNKHKHINGVESRWECAARATACIQDMFLDAATMARQGCDDDLLAAKGWSPASWVEHATTLEYDDEALAQQAMPEILELHLLLVTRGTAHLALVVSTIMRAS